MVCSPSQNNINIPAPGPGPSLPGLGLPFSFPKIPFPDIEIPEGIPEDILALIDKLFALLPAGIKLIPNPDSLTKGIWDALASLFTQLAPFLAFYKFIQALLNIILCIIDVLCALKNPYALSKAIRRLFKKCLPDFLSLFPWIALIAMILALLMLLLALIEYIIKMIIAYLKQILENLKVLTRAITVGDEESILAAITKISYLLCLMEQLFSILLVIASLFAIIKPLMEMVGRGVCAKGSSDCCNDDLCPSFIANLPDGQLNTTGRLIYQTGVGIEWPEDSKFDFLKGISFSSPRPERWQFIDTNPGEYKFLDIITPNSIGFGFTYWPESEVYASDANALNVPYLLDMNVSLDPRLFGNPLDLKGPRLFNIRDIIVKQKPTKYPLAWNNSVEKTDPVSGALMLVGGTVYEYDGYDGYTRYSIGEEPATLETLISRDEKSSIPISDDGYSFLDVQYNLRYNYPVLVEKNLITLGCMPEIAIEAATLNAEYGDLRNVLDKMGDLPDIGALTPDRKDGSGALGCLARSMAKFRGNINEESGLIFSNEITECLNNLKDSTIDTYTNGATAAADRFKSDFERDPEIQFIDNNIQVTIRLKDKTGTLIGVNVGEEIGAKLATIIKIKPTLGKISDIIYDGYDSFKAALTSNKAGEGELRAYLNGEVFATVINRDSIDLATEIVERVLPYEFIDHTSITYRRDQGDQFKTRYDAGDIAENGN
jgi:hypothetical protein